jgi:putative ABC transport system permease protein
MVVVLSKKTNDKAFGGTDSVGQTVRLDGHDFKVIGCSTSGRRRRSSTT